MEKLRRKSTIVLLTTLIVSICMLLFLNVTPSVKAATEPFTMDNGAQIRTVTGDEGLRFIAEVSPEYYNGIKAKAQEDTTVEYGMCIKQGKDLESYLIGGTNPDANMYKPMEKWDNSKNQYNPDNEEAIKYVYKFAITGIKAANYNTPVSALAYVKYTDKTDGQVKYEYAKNGTANDVITRSIFEVAVSHSQNEDGMGDEATFINGLIQTVVPDESAITLSKNAYTLKQGESADLFTVSVGGVEITPDTITVVDEGIATIENGKITAVDSNATEAKTTTIKVKLGAVEKSATVKVKGEVKDDSLVTLSRQGVASWNVEGLEKASATVWNETTDLTNADNFDIGKEYVSRNKIATSGWQWSGADFVFETDEMVYTASQSIRINTITTGDALVTALATTPATNWVPYYVLANDVYIESADPNGAILKGTLNCTFDGNGHKVIVNKTVKPTVVIDDNIRYSILFDKIDSSAIIKNTVFDITYLCTATNSTNGARIYPLAYSLSGTLQDCYVKTTRIDESIINWDHSGLFYSLSNGSKVENCIIETENKYLTWTYGSCSIDNLFVISAKPGTSQGTSGFSRGFNTNLHGFTNVSIYENTANLLSGNGVKVIDGVTATNTNETLTNSPQYSNNVFGDSWTFDSENDIIALNGRDVTGALGATYSGGVISWEDLDATTTEIYVDGVKVDVTLDGQSFAAADYLIANSYDLATAHSVEVRVFNGTYVYSTVVAVKATTIANETAFRAINGATASDYFVLTDNITITDTVTDGSAMISAFGGTLNGNGYKVTVTRNVDPVVDTTSSAWYGVLFGTVNSGAIIKNTQFDINYNAVTTYTSQGEARIGALANSFNGKLENCYVKATRSGNWQASCVFAELGADGKLINNIYETKNKHLIGKSSAGIITNALIISPNAGPSTSEGTQGMRSKFTLRSGYVHNFSGVSIYHTLAEMLSGNGIKVVDGVTTDNTNETLTDEPQTSAFTLPWEFNDTTVTLCGKTVG